MKSYISLSLQNIVYDIAMNVVKILAFFIMSCSIWAQSALVSAYTQQRNNARFEWYPNIGPWQSVTPGGGAYYGRLQFDIRGTLSELSQIDLAMVRRDFRRIYDRGFSTTDLELISAGWKVSFHTPNPFRPFYKRYTWLSDYRDAYIPEHQHTVNYGAWKFYEIPGMVFALLDLGGGQWQVSFVQYMEFNGYVQDPPEEYCECLDLLNHTFRIDQLPDTIRIFRK